VVPDSPLGSAVDSQHSAWDVAGGSGALAPPPLRWFELLPRRDDVGAAAVGRETAGASVWTDPCLPIEYRLGLESQTGEEAQRTARVLRDVDAAVDKIRNWNQQHARWLVPAADAGSATL
jgi:hypothetical protein